MIPSVDLEWMFKQSGGVKVSCDGEVTWGHWNPEGVEVFTGMGEVSTVQHVLTIPAGKLNVGNGSAITVDGNAFVVNRKRALIGADEIQLELREA
jgi:hypothetical protein